MWSAAGSKWNSTRPRSPVSGPQPPFERLLSSKHRTNSIGRYDNGGNHYERQQDEGAVGDVSAASRETIRAQPGSGHVLLLGGSDAMNQLEGFNHLPGLARCLQNLLVGSCNNVVRVMHRNQPSICSRHNRHRCIRRHSQSGTGLHVLRIPLPCRTIIHYRSGSLLIVQPLDRLPQQLLLSLPFVTDQALGLVQPALLPRGTPHSANLCAEHFT